MILASWRLERLTCLKGGTSCGNTKMKNRIYSVPAFKGLIGPDTGRRSPTGQSFSLLTRSLYLANHNLHYEYEMVVSDLIQPECSGY